MEGRGQAYGPSTVKASLERALAPQLCQSAPFSQFGKMGSMFTKTISESKVTSRLLPETPSTQYHRAGHSPSMNYMSP